MREQGNQGVTHDRWAELSWWSGRKTGLAGLPVEGKLPGFAGPTGWLNSPPLEVADLRGKVVLVDFWTYTCINWLRTLGYLRAWADKYRDSGLVLVGVHTPEFPFERDVDNVREAAAEMRVEYPIALDPDYAVWTAIGNRYWPAAYFADSEGQIRHHQFGEGDYEMCEHVIQQLLRESGRDEVPGDLVSPPDVGFEAQADWASVGSPETYLGAQQGHNFASPGGAAVDDSRAYTVPETLRLNSWALSGTWTVESRASVLDDAGGAIAFRFHARDVNVVLRSRTGDEVPFRVLVDGAAPGASHGVDVDAEGHGVLVRPRLYQLVRQHGAIVDRTFEITFLEPGVEAYVFTFG
jgi:thiol-disulfide isomerase/thioredoxin